MLVVVGVLWHFSFFAIVIIGMVFVLYSLWCWFVHGVSISGIFIVFSGMRVRVVVFFYDAQL